MCGGRQRSGLLPASCPDYRLCGRQRETGIAENQGKVVDLERHLTQFIGLSYYPALIRTQHYPENVQEIDP